MPTPGPVTDGSLNVPLAATQGEATGTVHTNTGAGNDNAKFPYVSHVDVRDSSSYSPLRDDTLNGGNTWSVLPSTTGAYDGAGVGALGLFGSMLNSLRATVTALGSKVAQNAVLTDGTDSAWNGLTAGPSVLSVLKAAAAQLLSGTINVNPLSSTVAAPAFTSGQIALTGGGSGTTARAYNIVGVTPNGDTFFSSVVNANTPNTLDGSDYLTFTGPPNNAVGGLIGWRVILAGTTLISGSAPIPLGQTFVYNGTVATQPYAQVTSAPLAAVLIATANNSINALIRALNAPLVAPSTAGDSVWAVPSNGGVNLVQTTSFAWTAGTGGAAATYYHPSGGKSTAIYNGLIVTYAATAVTGAPGLTLFVDRLCADGNWDRVWTSAAFTPTAAGRLVVAFGKTLQTSSQAPAFGAYAQINLGAGDTLRVGQIVSGVNGGSPATITANVIVDVF